LVGFIFAYSRKPTVGLSSAGGCRQTECWLPTFPVSVTVVLFDSLLFTSRLVELGDFPVS